MKRTIKVIWMHGNSQIIAFVIIDCSYFDTIFDRGLKLRLSCSPQCFMVCERARLDSHYGRRRPVPDGDCPVGHALTSQAPMCSVDSKHLFNDSYPKSSTHKPWKSASKIRSLSFFIPPKSSFGRDNLSECFFQALFKGVSTRFGLRIVEKCLENAFAKVGQAFQHLRLGWYTLPHPKEDFRTRNQR
jgi:hypothetical protein